MPGGRGAACRVDRQRDHRRVRRTRNDIAADRTRRAGGHRMSMALDMTRIDQPGIYALSDPVYLADPVVVPSLNNTTSRLLLISPKHAWVSHPRLGGAPDAERDST